MFHSILADSPVKSRFGTGAVISVVVHAVLIAVVFWVSNSKPTPGNDENPSIVFRTPPPPPPPAARPAVQKTAAVKPKPKKAIVVPKTIPIVTAPTPPEPPPDDSGPADETPNPNAVVGGQGPSDGKPGGQFGGQGTDVIADFASGMTRPIPSSDNARVEFTTEALQARVSGTMLVRCVITASGDVQGCVMLKGLEHMNERVLKTVSSWHFQPVTLDGRPVSVKYVIPIRLVLP